MKKFLSLCAVAALLSSCGTIINGKNQDIGVSSNPAGATVTVDGRNMGETPCNLQLNRGNSHSIVLSKEGYQSASATLSKSVSGWTWGNLLIGGIVGVVVDSVSGGMYKLEPKNVHVTLLPLAPAESAPANTAKPKRRR